MVSQRSICHAPTPQAKGRIERRHDYWQKRLVPLLAADHVVEPTGANYLLDQPVAHANQHAFTDQRAVILPAPNCPWWHYVWRK